MADKDGPPPPKKKKHHEHGGSHGAWKVAFADFMTSMFALFLVLWIISSTSASQKEAIAQYFQHPTVFRSGSTSPMDLGGTVREKKRGIVHGGGGRSTHFMTDTGEEQAGGRPQRVKRMRRE